MPSQRREDRELKAAAEALGRGAFRRAAAAYARAAGWRDRRIPGELDLHQRSIILYLAAGDREAARAALVRLRRRAARWAPVDGAWIESRIGDLLFAEGKEARAQAHYQAALALLSGRHPLRPELQLAIARCALRCAALRQAMRHARSAERTAEALNDRKHVAEALLLQARIESHYEGAPAFLLAFEEAASYAEEEGLRTLEREARMRWAEVLLALGLETDALRQAEAARRLALALRDAAASTQATLLVAAACTALAERMESEQGRGTAGGLRREAAHELRVATTPLRRREYPAALGEALLWGARLAALESPARAQRLADEAAAIFEGAQLGRLSLEAVAVGLGAKAKSAQHRSAWRRLARRAEAGACGELAAEAWRAVAQIEAEARSGVPSPGAERSLRRSHAWGSRVGPWVPSALDPARRFGHLASSMDLAAAALAREPEPKAETFAWLLAAREREAEGRNSPLERRRPLALGHPAVLYGADLAARRDRALEHGVRQPPVKRTALWRHQRAYLRQLGERSRREECPPLPRPRAGESLVVFARLGETVEVFCHSSKGVLFHAPAMPVEKWFAWAMRLQRETREARGWPDGVVPEPLANRARRTLRDFGRELWAPLWPSLVGTTRVLVLPDPALALLPFASLLLAAESVAWRQPATLSLLARPPAPGGRRWKGKPASVIAVASSHPDHELGGREARSATRIFGGRVLAGDRLLRTRDMLKTNAPSPCDLLRTARVLYLAAPVRAAAGDALTAPVTLGAHDAALGEILRNTPRLDLLLAPDLEVTPGPSTAVGRVVGSIDPKGAHAARAPRAKPTVSTNPQNFLAVLLREAADRLLVCTEPETRVSPTPILGAFCAGLARGDMPAEALFVAQRHAWDEGIHPVLWSGFSLWERG